MRYSIKTLVISVALGLSLILAGFNLQSALAEETITSSDTTTGTVIIHEVKSGGGNTELAQYVVLFNRSNSPISLTDWRIEYAKQALPIAHCPLNNWDIASPDLVTTATSDQTIPAQSYSTPIELAINDKGSGSVRIVDSTGTVTDIVGWGSEASPAPCFETAQSPNLVAGDSLQRYLDCSDNLPTDKDNNSLDFFISDVPGSAGQKHSPDCAQPPNDSDPDVEPTPTPDPSNICSAVTITELLPNPAGADGGKEFIELHNPTDKAVTLTGCNLQTSASQTTSFDLAGIRLEAGEYRALSDDTTGLTLSNASGGTVWLLDQTVEIQTIVYPGDIDDDATWALNNDEWAITFAATPGSLNQAMPAKPCEAGLVRNPETNRCINPPSDSAGAASAGTTASVQSTACKPGQERNPTTNRCRAVTANTGSATTACKAGQERNPETNRCRNIATAAAAAKACPAGQERNPETNRCRKISAAAAGAKATVEDKATPTGSAGGNITWLIVGLVIASAIAYGIYEWRQEISLFFRRRFGRLQTT